MLYSNRYRKNDAMIILFNGPYGRVNVKLETGVHQCRIAAGEGIEGV